MKKILLLLSFCCVSVVSFALSTLGNSGGTTAAAVVCVPATSAIIAEFSITQTGANTTLNTVNFTTTGTYVAADITDFKLYGNFTNTFGSAIQLSTTMVAGLGPGAHSFTGIGTPLVTFGGGISYYWIVADQPGTATACNTLTVSGFTAASIVVAAGGTAGTTAASGTQTFNKVPVITATAVPTSLCVGTNLALTGTGVACNTYAWSGPGGYTAAVMTPPSFAVTAGNAGVYSLTATNICGVTTATTAPVVVNLPPTGVSATASPNPVCLGSNLTLTGAATGAASYQWIGPAGSGFGSAVQNPPPFATVAGDAGVYTLIAISAAGCSDTVNTAAVLINTQPTGVTATASPLSLCAGANLTLTGTGVGGTAPTYTWTGPGIGSLVGLTPASFATTIANSGIYTLTASVAGCADVTAMTGSVVVNSAPTGVSATATPNPVCNGTSFSLTGAATGATTFSWTGPGGYTSAVQNPPAIIASFADSGVYNFTATNAAGCSASSSVDVVVGSAPTAITGSSTVCVGGNTSLSNTVAGGVWSSSNPGVATVDPVFGVVSGVSPGTVNINYSVGSCVATFAMTVNSAASAGIISGPTSLCTGANVTLVDGVPGGTWSASNTNGTISATGVLTGNSPGIDTITYLISGACGVVLTNYTDTISMSPNSGLIAGPAVICAGSFVLLTDTAIGGVWSVSNATGTVSGTGLFTAMTAGVDTVYYTSTTSCGSSQASKTISINPLPDTGMISGPNVVCVGSTIPLTETQAGGVWSATNSNATVSGSGVVTGMVAGIDTIEYSVTNGCGTLHASWVVSIGATGAGSITGPGSVCVGSIITLSDATPGGNFSSGNSNATVTGAGLLTGITPGIDTITYTIVDLCGVMTTTTVVTINALPVAGSVSGPTNLCPGTVITLTDGIAGGSWSSENTSVATVDAASGGVTGVAGGDVTINYTVTNAAGCTAAASYPVTVNAAPVVAAITGVTNECVGGITSLADLTDAGLWTSGNPSVASVDSGTGVVTGVSGGIVTISYTFTSPMGCVGYAFANDTVNTIPFASPIIGSNQVCAGSSTSLSDSVAFGMWSSTNLSVATVDPASGVVTGVAAGSATIVYMVTNSCGAVTDTMTMNVNAVPLVDSIISTANNICAGSSIQLSDGMPGGIWSSSNTSVATVSATTGLVTGVSAGTDTINYTITNMAGCTGSTYTVITFGGSLSAAVVPGGAASLCNGSDVYMYVTSSGTITSYQWMMDGNNIAGANSYHYTATDSGRYSVMVTGASCSEILTGPTVSLPPHATITFVAPDLLYTGSYYSYQWLLNGSPITGANTSIYLATMDGLYSIVVSNAGGCTDTASYLVTDLESAVSIVNQVAEITLYPNPVTNVLNIVAKVPVTLSIFATDGRQVMDGLHNGTVDLSALPTGVYVARIYDANNALIRTQKITKL